MNVSINDIKEMAIQHDIVLSDEQIQNVLRDYNIIVMDKSEGWDELIKDLILNHLTIQMLREQNRQYEQTSNKMYITYTQFNKRNKQKRIFKSCNIHLFKETICKTN